MKNISKIRKNIDSNYMEIYADYFGCSLLTLFTQDNLEFETIEDEVEAFLYLLKKFIDSGLILVVSPLSGEKEKIIQNIKFWDTTSDAIIEYIRQKLPKNLNSLYGRINDNDSFVKFWYKDCPDIRWVNRKTGKIY
ncbi:hypothetical protein [Campylobacter concisus]|uniref:hypothetical protein n=1 Tax=Campylobacter concisus TaxID=199 RepID=UPI00054FA2A6|nr:hypothetical protein [Campylobacter concisus]